MALLKIAFVFVTFLGSFLLFLVEPMAGKRLLPLLGGSPAVWTTCLVFFQVALLLEYLGAHVVATMHVSNQYLELAPVVRWTLAH